MILEKNIIDLTLQNPRDTAPLSGFSDLDILKLHYILSIRTKAIVISNEVSVKCNLRNMCL